MSVEESYMESQYDSVYLTRDKQYSKLITLNSSNKILLSCMIGNLLEWYDFIIYGYFSTTFGFLFFPNTSPLAQALASWGIFWAGFIARPLGSVIFGHIGDRVSRKYALTLSIYTMAIPTALMGCLPTYDQLGILASFFLVLLRILQGFAIGGEFTGAMIFLVEHAPAKAKGFWGSWASFSAVLGVLVGSVIVAILSHYLSPSDLQAWGWRLPFLLSVLGSIVGGYMRNCLVDPNIFLNNKRATMEKRLPLKELFTHYKGKIGSIVLLDFLTAIGFFVVAIFLVTYFRVYLNLSEGSALLINTFSMSIFAVFTLIGGWLSDKVGTRIILTFPCVGFLFFSYPLFIALQTGNHYILLFIQGFFALIMGIFFGAIPKALVDIMPVNVRFSGLSISHNISMAIFGGSAPLLATQLICSTNDLASPAYLLIIASFLSLCSLPLLRTNLDNNHRLTQHGAIENDQQVQPCH